MKPDALTRNLVGLREEPLSPTCTAASLRASGTPPFPRKGMSFASRFACEAVEFVSHLPNEGGSGANARAAREGMAFHRTQSTMSSVALASAARNARAPLRSEGGEFRLPPANEEVSFRLPLRTRRGTEGDGFSSRAKHDEGSDPGFGLASPRAQCARPPSSRRGCVSLPLPKEGRSVANAREAR
jgi:hypothetical protein